MKKTILLLSGILLISLFSSNLFAQDEEVTSTIKKEFNVNADALLKAKNKYGEIRIENWDKNQVAFDVEMQVVANTKEKANKVLKDIKVNISGSKDLVEAYVDLSDVKCKNDCNYEVIMNIMMPASMHVDLLMEYGKLHAEEISGEAKIGVKYGVLNIIALNNNDVELFLKYSSASINRLNKAKMEIAYSEFSVGQAASMAVESEYSQLEAENIRSIELESQYDEIDIDECFSFAMDSKFTHVEIDELSKDLMVEMKYGNLEVENINKNFNKIHINTEYANASIGIDSDASYTLEAEAKYGSVNYPKDEAKVSKETEGYTKFYYSGTVGEETSPQSEVIIKCKNANVNL